MKKSKIYKPQSLDVIRMFPSDPLGSLDDFIFLNFSKNYTNLGVVLWKKH